MHNHTVMKEVENKFTTLLLCALIFIVFFLVQGILGVDLAWNVGSIEPNFFFSMIAHGSVAHLLGNLFALGLFGLLLEGTVGTKRYLWILLAAGVLGNLAGFMAGYHRVLGISGAIYGVFGALAVLRPRLIVWAAGVPVPMIVAALGWMLFDIIGALSGMTTTGHFAHLGGGLAGVIAGFSLKKQLPPPPENRKRMSRTEKKRLDSEIDEWEQRYMVA